MQFLLHLNEDFEDNLLQDAVEMLNDRIHLYLLLSNYKSQCGNKQPNKHSGKKEIRMSTLFQEATAIFSVL